MLSIPVEDLREYIRVNSANPRHRISRILRKENLTQEQLADYVSRLASSLNDVSEDGLMYEEYQVLSNSCRHGSSSIDFKSIDVAVPTGLTSIIKGISQIKRLREVRALVSFSRINPTTTLDNSQPVVGSTKDWLPAIENFGEGIFLDFATSRLNEWEQRPAVLSRVNRLKQYFLEEFNQNSEYIHEMESKLSPRFYLLHTIAHLLIRAVTNISGYSMASIRERIYSQELAGQDRTFKTAGILIYTASSDADGTLGGLSGIASARVFQSFFESALQDGKWCSSDPLCLNRGFQMSLSASGASCHNCTLLPETSCVYFNRFLDRGLLFGTDDSCDISFFKAEEYE
jgi:hypothetical protein